MQGFGDEKAVSSMGQHIYSKRLEKGCGVYVATRKLGGGSSIFLS
jgi:hypothetical protein